MSGVDLARLSMLAFLHDAGKLHPGFQAKGWPSGHGVALHGHEGEGAAIFCSGVEGGAIARNLHSDAIASWGEPETLAALRHAFFSHHGRPIQMLPLHSNAWGGGRRLGYDAIAASTAIGRLLPIWFPEAFSEGDPLPDAPDLQHLVCGLVALADWLGSNRAIFEFAADISPGYMEIARRKAQGAVADVGLDVSRWRAVLAAPPPFAAVAAGRSARAAQEAIGDWPTNDQLVILEAETGSGKTEAALWRFARLFAAGRVDALYFAVPTRAAARQLHGRVLRSMRSLFGPVAPEPVLAIPGYIKAGDHEGQALPDFTVLWPDDPDEETRLARWAAESARRFLAAPVAVGTVDQAMLAGLQVKHAHLRGAALSRALLVIDEVHSSDPWMTEIQAHLLDTHLARGGSAMLMSATLGASARMRWLGGRRAVPPSLAEAMATPYPAVWGRGGAMRAVTADGRRKTVAMGLAGSWSAEEAARHAIEAASAGARALVVRNTVKAAVETFAAVHVMGGADLLWRVADGPALHHSRFAAEDRKLLDDAVEAALSKNAAERPSGGAIVIGTQTLEQSLDICADILITDLCPADVLLQRIGRLHRHNLPRPAGFERPRCIVLSPEGGLDRLAAPTFENGLGGWESEGVLEGVYRNLHACELTRRLVEAHPEWTIPDMNRLIVEGATHPERIEAVSAEKGVAWARYWDKVYGKDLADAQAARGLRLAVDRPFGEKPFPPSEERIRTRLGAEGARIRFAPGTIGPFGQPITSVTCPAHWRGIVAEEPVAAVRDRDGALRFAGSSASFRYSRTGFVRE